MDPLREASGSHIVAPRHIINEPPLPEVDNALNTTVLCYDLTIQPDFQTYFEALHPYAWVLWGTALAVVVVICLLFTATLRAARQHWAECGSNLTVVLAVYPLVAISGLVVLAVPRARLLAEAAAQQAVMVGMYHLYHMLLAEAGGPGKLARRAGDSRLETRVLPCCCWPCCVIPRPVLDLRSLEWLRYLVLQLPIVQGIIYSIILVFSAEDMNLYLRSFIFFQPFVVVSILSGVWGINMMVRTCEASGLSCRPRFLALQLLLIVVKVQCGIAKTLPEMVTLPCVLNLNPAVVVHMIQYSIMIVETLALSLWAWRLYRAPATAGEGGKVRQVVVAVLDDHQKPNTIGRSLSANGAL
ncbi:organic solute transporter alpha-like protein [Pectinophora gossypiella]|uniref:organic solute transporter alpha-like protein n=1 Tax=Pectinophora gossypiella TaxID=13191 RepID=UPI00214E8908|nr:organic solute transporter alpha-like protein [Pectinophora gossypiella]